MTEPTMTEPALTDRSMTVAVLGLGEAGGLIALDRVAAGVTVRGFDPRVSASEGVQPATGDADACRGADLVLSVNSGADAVEALIQGLSGCAPGIVWAELNTTTPGRKQEVVRAADDAVRVVDVALMSPVPGRGLRTPMLASGPAADEYARALRPLGDGRRGRVARRAGSAGPHRPGQPDWLADLAARPRP